MLPRQSMILRLAACIVLLVGLVLPVLASQAAQIPGQPNHAYLPVAGKEIPATGRVTNNGAPLANVTVYLMVTHNGGTSYSEFSRTTTDGDGRYMLRSPILFSGSDAFYVDFRNTSNASLVRWFSCNTVVYNATADKYACDMEVHDIHLVAPASGSHVNLPREFYWTRRSATSDSYVIDIYEYVAGNLTPFSQTKPLGYIDHITITDAPPNSVVGKQYVWSMIAVTPSGSAYAYYGNNVYWNNLSGSPAMGAAPLELFFNAAGLPVSPIPPVITP